MNISSSSLCSRASSSSSFLSLLCSSDIDVDVDCFGGSHDATRRWLRARATLVLFRIMSASDLLLELELGLAGVGVDMDMLDIYSSSCI